MSGLIYSGYEFIINLCGVKFVIVDIILYGFKFIVCLIEDVLIFNIKCVVFFYLLNFIGVILFEEELKSIVVFLKGRNVFVLFDEIYSELIYDRFYYFIVIYLWD